MSIKTYENVNIYFEIWNITFNSVIKLLVLNINIKWALAI